MEWKLGASHHVFRYILLASAFVSLYLMGFISINLKGSPNILENRLARTALTVNRVIGSPVIETQMPKCSFSLLKRIFLTTEKFPGDVYWINNQPGNNDTYEMKSSHCRFPTEHNGNIMSCLRGRKVKKIALIGDSNTKRMVDELIMLIGKQGTCIKVKEEGLAVHNHLQPDAKYFSNDTRGHKTNQRHCSSCLSKKFKCMIDNTDSTILHVEFISMEYLMDNEIYTALMAPPRINYCKLAGFNNGHGPCPQSHTTQQFIYKQYFRQTGYPDVILHFLNNHDKAIMNAQEELMAAELLGRMIEMYVPATSRVIFLGKMHEEVHLKPEKWIEDSEV